MNIKNVQPLYTGVYGKNNILEVKKETRMCDYGDPTGEKVPVDGISIKSKDKNEVVTADVFLAYANLSEKKDKRREQIADVIEGITNGAKINSLPSSHDDDYQCGRDSHEAYLY